MSVTYNKATKKYYRDGVEWDPASEGFTVKKEELEKYLGPPKSIAGISGVKAKEPGIMPDFLEDLRFSSPRVYKHIVEPIVENPGATGSIVGGALTMGNPLGFAGGGVAGNLLGLAYNRLTGRNSEPISTEEALGIGAQGLLDATMTGAGDIPAQILSKKLGTKVAGSYTPGIVGSEAGLTIPERMGAWLTNRFRKSTAEDIAPVYSQSPSGVPYIDRMKYSAGDLSQSPLIEWGEKGFQGDTIAALKREQEDIKGRMLDEFRGNILSGGDVIQPHPIPVGPITQEAYGGAIQEGLKGGLKDIKGQQTLAWDTIKANLDRSTTKHQIATKFETKEFKDPNSGSIIKITQPSADGIKEVEYRGLIPTTETQSKLEEFAPAISKIFSDDAIQSLPTESLRTKYKLVKDMLENFMKPVKEMRGGQLVDLTGKEFEQLKNARTGLNNIYYRVKKLGRTDDERMLKEVTSAMTKDLDDGAASLGIAEPWERANKLRVEQGKMYPENVLKNVFRSRSQEAYAQDIVPNSIGHAEKTTEIYQALPNDHKQYYRAGAFEKLIKDSTTAEGGLDNVKFKNLVNDIDSGYRVVFTPAERKQFTEFAKAVGLTTREGSTVGLSALNYRRGYIALNLTSGLGAWALTGQPSYGLASAGMSGTALIGLKNFAKVFTRPNVARTAIELAKLDPNSPKAKLMSKSILHLLRGARVMFGTGEGFYPAVISEDGRILPERQQ